MKGDQLVCVCVRGSIIPWLSLRESLIHSLCLHVQFTQMPSVCAVLIRYKQLLG